MKISRTLQGSGRCLAPSTGCAPYRVHHLTTRRIRRTPGGSSRAVHGVLGRFITELLVPGTEGCELLDGGVPLRAIPRTLLVSGDNVVREADTATGLGRARCRAVGVR